MESKFTQGRSTWDWPYFHDDPKQENASQMERWSLNQAPTWTVPPLAIANRHYDTNNQLVQNTRYRLILTKASNLDWLTRDKHAMRDLCTVAKEGSHHWVPAQDLPFNEVILFAYAADHSSRPTYVCLLSGPYHPTDLPRTRDPPERDTQRPAATTTTAESPQIPDEEDETYLPRQSEPG
jgi:hypothetical protein